MNRLNKFLASPAQDRAGPRVDALIHRATESSFPGDRKEAVAELKDLISQDAAARTALGSFGFPPLLTLTGEDLELDRSITECLAIAVFAEDGESGAVDGQQLARTPGALPFFLRNLLPETDFYIKYHSLQALRGLVAACPSLVQEAVQGEPLAVGALLDVLSGGHEVLRNEVLLLLSCLLPGAPELAKLVVFEGGFDRLLDIAREEGLGAPGAPASLVAADCLDLGAALVRDNPATLRMLWGTGHLSPLLGLLPGDAADPILPALLRLVAAAAGPSQAVSRQGSGLGGGAETRQHVLAAALAAGWLPRLLALGLGSCLGTAPAHDQQQAEALLTLSCLLHDAPATRDAFLATTQPAVASALRLPPATTAPGLLLTAALSGKLGPRAAAGADRVLEACALDPGATLALPADGEGLRLGECLRLAPRDCEGAGVDAEATRVALGAARTAAALAHALLRAGAAERATLLLRAPRLMDEVAASLAAATAAASAQARDSPRAFAAQAVLAGGLRAVLAWTAGCPAAAGAFLAAAARAPFLMGAVGGRGAAGDALCRGLAALVLGVCALDGRACAEAGAQQTAARLADVVRGAAMGEGAYRGLTQALARHASVRCASLDRLTARDEESGAEVLVLTPRWGAALADCAARVEAGLFGAAPAGDGAWAGGYHGQSLEAAPPVSTSADPAPARDPRHAASTASGDSNGRDIAPPPALRPLPAIGASSPALWNAGQGASSPSSGPLPTHPGPQATLQPPAQPPQPTTDSPATLADLAEARAALQDALAEAAGLRTSLQASRDEADALRASLGRLEGEMEGLSSAYSSLDSHAAELQAELARLRKRERHGAASEGGGPSEGLGAAPPPEDDELTDLLVCLGQEEAKVAVLCARLEELGVDSLALLEAAAPPLELPPDLT
ncbi:CGL135 [Auxenochlorella protothecoides x Auxenochlorella symbiontica]